MGTRKKPYESDGDESQSTKKETRIPMSLEARENQLISLAVDLAEQKLRDGTASNQVICHYLKLGTTREKLEKEILEKEKELVTAKTEAMKSQKRTEELYAKALYAMKEYKGDKQDD